MTWVYFRCSVVPFYHLITYQGGMWPLVCDHHSVVCVTLTCHDPNVPSYHRIRQRFNSHRSVITRTAPTHYYDYCHLQIVQCVDTDDDWISNPFQSGNTINILTPSTVFLQSTSTYLAWCLINLPLNTFEFAFGQLVLEQFLQINSPDMRHSIKIVNVWVNNGMR